MDEIIKKRTMKIDGSKCHGCEDQILKMLFNSKGIKKADINNKSRVKIEYDLLMINYEMIETMLDQTGCIANKNLFDKFKTGWINFTEENEYINMKSKSKHCCSVSDEQMKYKHKNYGDL